MRRPLILLLAASALIALVACATTSSKLTTSWANPDFKGPLGYQKVFVLFASPNHNMRVQIEGAVVARLEMHGVMGLPANIAVPDSTLRDIPRLKEQLAQINVDGVVVMRPIGKSERTQYVSTSPGYWGAYPEFWGYYNYMGPTMWDPGFYVTDTTYKVETRIFDLKSGRLVWGGMSDTMNPTDAQMAATELAKAIGEDLRASGLVR